MKKILLCMICILLIFGLFGCKAEGGESADTEPPATEAPTQPEQAGGTVTLMVYMIGSDLEAKGGAGTDDLEEMAESGIDTEKANVLVYAGGSGRWHNDRISKDDGHTLLKLTGTDFETVTTWPEASMGEPDSLTAFLNYSYENYPADSYALILWDHGNGPLIGYGKDMLYDNDSLTLLEMQEAMEASPFKGDNKLAWVGFDACLMASAELACVWADYADYLISSQEIEPAFGWNYDFLQALTTSDTATLSKTITENYLAACEAYYERKGYEDRDTTLSCMDLSKAGELESAIEALFTKASGDVDGNYNRLSVSRVNTRALGRASTGSEYDLIDLNDMAEQMKSLYPDEAAAIQAVLQEMTVANATNAENLSGLSLYYPFYNKGYYEKSWGQIYGELNVFPQYAAYLDSYAQIWLGSDLLETVAESGEPETAGAGEYTLELTPEQAESYADGRYYILMREGEGIYNVVFASHNITKDDTTLTAHFDGQVLYAKNDFDDYWIPVTQEHDTVGDITRYSVYVNLTNETALMMDRPEGWEHQVAGHRFHLAVNNKTKEISTSALVPYDTQVQTDTLSGGKLEDADLSGWTTYYFLQERHRYLERYENGTVMPLSKWRTSSYFSANTSKIGDGLEFLFAPLVSGEYYLIFEVEDTQGSRYCSELLPIQVSGELEQEYQREVISKTWESGDSITLLEEAGVTIALTTVDQYGDIVYVLEVTNENDFDIAVKGFDLCYNNEVYCEDGSFGYYKVPANSTVQEPYGFGFGAAQNMQMMGDLRSLEFSVNVETDSGEKTLIREQWFQVILTEKTTYIPAKDFFSYDAYDIPTRDILATEQTLLTKDGVTVTLLSLGGVGDDAGTLAVALKIQNTASEARYVRCGGAVLDGIYMECESGPLTVPAAATVYRLVYMDGKDLDVAMVTSPKTVTLQLYFMEFATLEGGGGFTEYVWCPVTLSQKGSGCSFREGSVLLEENGVRIGLKAQDAEYYYNWYCTVVNDSGQDIQLQIENVKVNGQAVDLDQLFAGVGFYTCRCGDGQKTVLKVYADQSFGDQVDMTFDVVAYDFTSESVLWKFSESVTLTGEI